MAAITNRYEFVLLFDVENGNPHGDPDAGNMPGFDPETGHGLVTDVCLKRKIRNHVALKKEGEKGCQIYIQEKSVLNETHKAAYKEIKLKPESNELPKDLEDAKKVTGCMSSNFYDIRAFGAVMTTEINSGQVRGPVQLKFARSIEPIFSAEHTITRMAVTKEEDLEKKRTMGRKFTIPYALYRTHGYISAPLAEQTGFSEDDLKLLWKSLMHMFDHDRSAARGEMTARKLIVFKHQSKLGNAPAYVLFDAVKIKRKASLGKEPSRSFEDYEVSLYNVPDGVELLELI